MTLIELLFFLSCFALGGASAGALHTHFGIWIAIPGFIAGFFTLPFLSFYVYPAYRRIAYRGNKSDPECICGSTEYKWDFKSPTLYQHCTKCGRTYIKAYPKVWILENGEKKPYKQMVFLKGWHPFSGKSTPHKVQNQPLE